MATKRMIEKFETMTDDEKRVAVARDVIKQIDSGFYRPRSTYFEPVDNFDDIITHKNVRGKKCEVCLKGAVLLSRIGKFNHTPEYPALSLDEVAQSLSDELDEFPDADELEMAFEREYFDIAEVVDYMDGLGPTYDADETLEEFDSRTKAEDDFCVLVKKFNNLKPEYRLKIIMQSIIDNKGKFKPLTLLDYEIV